MNVPLLNIQGLITQFSTRQGPVTAVDGLDLQLHSGQTLGLVGESGCGKSVAALSIMRLLPKPAGRIANGQILFQGRDLLKLREAEMRRVRGNEISMIFQEPMTSLNPVYTVGFQIYEALQKHRKLSRRQAGQEAVNMLQLVGIPEPDARINDYPHQMSGGMRQRVMIAMALSCRPKVMIADEPTTALDVTIQAQILDLISRLKQEIGMSVLLITHDLGVVAETCQQVLVMYAGRAVEKASAVDLFEKPTHPYTLGLFASIPKVEDEILHPISGVVPSLHDLPEGCAFQDRCAYRQARCLKRPPWIEISPEHWVCCWRYDTHHA